ncbi:MAG TPA: CPBP family intramembrane glutamic endopeptidase, partial [Oceanipulchritudo sp.]|nr:CPBP family intramembrane glutamic endopeptidase [Oceanipulchritudo sp.]
MNSHSKKDRISAMVQLHGSAALVILFSLLLHDHRPFALLLLAVAVAFILFWAWRVDLSQLEHALGLHSSKWAWYLVCLSVAVLMAGLLRWRDGYPLPPGPARPFLLMAFVVGATEEVLFRGYFLGRLRETWGEWPALTFAALYHSAYKTAL